MTYAYQNVLGSLFAEAAQLEPLIPLLRLCGLRLLRSRLALTRRLRELEVKLVGKAMAKLVPKMRHVSAEVIDAISNDVVAYAKRALKE